MEHAACGSQHEGVRIVAFEQALRERAAQQHHLRERVGHHRRGGDDARTVAPFAHFASRRIDDVAREVARARGHGAACERERGMQSRRLARVAQVDQLRIVTQHGAGQRNSDPAAFGVSKVASGDVLTAAVAAAAQTKLTAEIVDYVVRIVRATRDGAAFELGASPRAAAMLAAAARAWAALDGRDYVVPDDIKLLARPVLAHRLIAKSVRQGERGDSAEMIMDEIIAKAMVPA